MRDHVDEAEVNVIHTVGYEKSELSAYVSRLRAAEVEILIDVRDRPISRKRGFSKSALCAAVEEAGIAYLHVQALGDPKPGRDAARAGDHDRFVSIFTAHMALESTCQAVEGLASEIKGRRVCLTCYERDHTACHRTIVADRLAEITGAAIQHLTV